MPVLTWFEPCTPETLRDLLAMVDRRATVEQLRGWTREQRIAAEAWAVAVHLGGVVGAPPAPGWVAVLPRFHPMH